MPLRHVPVAGPGRRLAPGALASLLLAALCLAVAPAPATAEDAAQLLADCQKSDGPVATARIAACNKLIDDKSLDADMRLEALLNRGNAEEAQGNDAAAAESYTLAIELDPQRSIGYFNRANVLDQMGQAERALADYDKAIAIDPGEPEYYNNRGVVLLDASQYQRALDDFNQAIKLGLTEASVFVARAAAFEGLGLKAEALADYRKVIELEPGNEDAVEALKRLQ